MHINGLHPLHAERLHFLALKAASPSLWQEEAKQALARLKPSLSDTTVFLEALHQAQRLNNIFLAGLENNADFRAHYDSLALPSWKNFTSPPVEDALQAGLADRLYNAKPDDVAQIRLGDGGRRTGELLVERSFREKLKPAIEISDDLFQRLVFKYTDAAGIEAIAKSHAPLFETLTKTMVTRPGLPDGPLIERDHAKAQLYARLTERFGQRVTSGEIFYTLTVIPTRKDAELDGMDYGEYCRLFFEMCDQPWEHIGKAQEKLIAELDAGKTLHFTNEDGTDISMAIEGFTFCNSLIARNVPGSEVFSAPRRDSVNGTIVAKGRFSARDDALATIENLTLVFKNGKLVGWHADKGQDIFEKEISIDEGALYVGEIGIGTNPHLRRHVRNSLLVEKIGGSFHIALGRAFNYKTYLGTPVNVDNGNRSILHWDITTLLHGKKGCIYLDGKPIMKDGLFLDPDLDVLNRGWAALPEAQRPVYWQKKLRGVGATL